MKSIILSTLLFYAFSFSGISQRNCSPVLDSNTLVIKSDTTLTSCNAPYSILVCQGVKVFNSNPSCTNHFYLENNAKLTLDSNNFPGSLMVWAKIQSTLDANFQSVLNLNYQTGTYLLDTNGSLNSSQTHLCPTLTFDYSKLPGGVSGCGTTTGINKVELSKFSFEVYPNPANEFINIKTNLDNYTLKLFTATGKLVWTGTSKKIETNYPKGVYFLKIENAENRLTKKVIIN
ncbi:MAG: T9SS type A sorting domain-containing protein [Flavobacteriales bacterium]